MDSGQIQGIACRRYLVAVGLAGAVLVGSGCGSSQPAETKISGQPSADKKPASTGSKLTKLSFVDTKPGSGPAAQQGDLLFVLYRGTLTDGTEFDSNIGGDKKLFPLSLGAGTVIKGWDQGLIGVKQGGERKISIPAKLAYGEQSQGKIPPNSDLFFDVEVKKLITKSELNEVTVQDIKKGTGKPIENGDHVVMNYTIKSWDGDEIDSTSDRKKPLPFVAGKGDILPGLEAGIMGMRKGGERKITLPPRFAPHGPRVTPGMGVDADVTIINASSK